MIRHTAAASRQLTAGTTGDIPISRHGRFWNRKRNRHEDIPKHGSKRSPMEPGHHFIIPIGSMVLVYNGIYANIWGILMGSMLPYITYMDPMGYFIHLRETKLMTSRPNRRPTTIRCPTLIRSEPGGSALCYTWPQAFLSLP